MSKAASLEKSDSNDLTSKMRDYLTENIFYTVDEKMRQGMELYFELANKHNLITENKPLRFTSQ